RVYLFLRNDVKFERPRMIGRDRRDEAFTERPNVFRFHAGIGQDRHLLIDFRCRLQPKLLLLVARHAWIAGIRQLRSRSNSEYRGRNREKKLKQNAGKAAALLWSDHR